MTIVCHNIFIKSMSGGLVTVTLKSLDFRFLYLIQICKMVLMESFSKLSIVFLATRTYPEIPGYKVALQKVRTWCDDLVSAGVIM